MKKFLVVMLIALFAVTSIFADVVVGQGKVEGKKDTDFTSSQKGDDATLTVNLQVTPEGFYGYYYGFTTSSSDPDNANLTLDLPEAVDYVDLAYDTEKHTASDSSIYMYWKVRSARGSVLSVYSSGLVETTTSEVIPLIVTTDKAHTKVSCEEASANKEIFKATLSAGFQHGIQNIVFATGTMTGSEVGTYAATLKMSITSNA